MRLGISCGALLALLLAGSVLGEAAVAPKSTPRHSQAQVGSVAFQPQGNLLAVGEFQRTLLFDARSGRRVGLLKGGAGVITGLAFSPDGKLLAAASGVPGRFGEIVLWDVAQRQVARKLYGHSDALYSIAFSPKGDLIAAASYDQLVSLWSLEGETEPRMLKGHIDAVYSLAFDSEGKWLATASGDRTIKLWDVAEGRRLYTLNQPVDEQFGVAFHPSKPEISAVGGDKILRTWQVTATGATMTRNVFAHEGRILRLLYHPGGDTIYTTSEDRSLKSWRTTGDNLTEKVVFEKQSDWVLALATNDDGSRLAVGRYDGSLTVYDAATGEAKLQLLKPAPRPSSPAPAQPKAAVSEAAIRVAQGEAGKPTLLPAKLNSIAPRGARRGQEVIFTLSGNQIADAKAILFDDPAITAEVVPPAADAKPNANQLRLKTAIGNAARLGVHRVSLQTPRGVTGSVSFAVGNWPERPEAEPNNRLTEAPLIELPVTVLGSLQELGDTDTFRFKANRGDELVFQIVAEGIGSKLNSVLTLLDAEGRALARNDDTAAAADSTLGYRFQEAGTYGIRISDIEVRGGSDFTYRLNIGKFGYVTRLEPLGLPGGTTGRIRAYGFNLGLNPMLEVAAPPAISWNQRTTVSLADRAPAAGLLNSASLAVGLYPEVVEDEARDAAKPDDAQTLSVPGTVNGRIFTAEVNQPADVDLYRFRAKKGQSVILEVDAARLGSPLDSRIEVLDSAGRPIETATLRCVFETAITLRDHDSRQPSFRIFAWEGVRMNDYMYCEGELLKVTQLPKGPDANIEFRSFRGQRMGLGGTTPRQHAENTPIYKVIVYPPKTTLPPNGRPVFKLHARNDDGGPGFGRDSYLAFNPPADGEYLVRIQDAQGRSGFQFGYRLSIHRPQPDFRLNLVTRNITVNAGAGATVEVFANRVDGFSGAIEVRLEGLPPGFTATRATIEAGQDAALLLVTAAENATAPFGRLAIRAVGSARIGEELVERSAPAGDPKTAGPMLTVLPPADIRVSTDLRQVTLRPGGSVLVEARVARQHGFTGRVPILVRNLPYGVRVENVGLNGVLVTERDSARKFVIVCEPWVQPMRREFYAVGRVETSTGPAESAAPPLTLIIVPAAPQPE